VEREEASFHRCHRCHNTVGNDLGIRPISACQCHPVAVVFCWPRGGVGVTMCKSLAHYVFAASHRAYRNWAQGLSRNIDNAKSI
jgi:hypothetical protein